MVRNGDFLRIETPVFYEPIIIWVFFFTFFGLFRGEWLVGNMNGGEGLSDFASVFFVRGRKS